MASSMAAMNAGRRPADVPQTARLQLLADVDAQAALHASPLQAAAAPCPTAELPAPRMDANPRPAGPLDGPRPILEWRRQDVRVSGRPSVALGGVEPNSLPKGP